MAASSSWRATALAGASSSGWEATDLPTGGSSEVGWNLLDTVEQANGVPVDPGGLGTGATVFQTGTGTLHFVGAAHVTDVDGYQEAVCRWTTLLSDLIPDFDPNLDVVELALSLDNWVHGSVELGVGAGIVDSGTVDASLVGAVFGVRQVGVSSNQVQHIGAAAPTLGANTGLCDQVYGLIQWGLDSATGNYSSHISVSALIEGESRPRLLIADPSAVMRASTLAQWRLTCFAYHDSTDPITGQTMDVRVAWRRFRRATRPLA